MGGGICRSRAAISPRTCVTASIVATSGNQAGTLRMTDSAGQLSNTESAPSSAAICSSGRRPSAGASITR